MKGVETYQTSVSEDISSSTTVYEFISEGKNGTIEKMVQYSQYQYAPGLILYNLAMGDRKEDGTLDDEKVTNNNDIMKVLATVTETIYHYTEANPDRIIYFEGNTPTKQKLYVRGIMHDYLKFSADFNIQGLRDEKWVQFENNTDYVAITLKRKMLPKEALE